MAKSEKTCIVCGKKFQGTKKAKVCSGGCRVKLKRLLESGKKPAFELVAKVEENNKPENKVKILKERENISEPTKERQNPLTTSETEKKEIKTHKPYLNDAIRKKLGWS